MDNKMLFSGLGDLDYKVFKQLLDTQSLVDCTLACDGGKISAHKIVLSACSNYLAKIFLEHPVEHPILILPELNIQDVKILVHYMYTGELLKSDTINSVSLLRTAAILSINSVVDLELSSHPASSPPPAALNQCARSPIVLLQQQQQQQQQRLSLVDQISLPLLAAFGQQQQQQKQGFSQFGEGAASLLSNTSDQFARNSLTSSHDGSSFNSIIGAAAAAAAAAVSASSLDVGGNQEQSGAASLAQYYNGLAANSYPAPSAVAINSSSLSSTGSFDSSSSSTSSSPVNSRLTAKSEPYSYSSAITGITTLTSGASSQPGSTSSTSATISNEFRFKCPVCQNNFQTICSFEYHMQRAHSVTSFGCEICRKPFASLRYVLTDHMRRCHGWKGPTIGGLASGAAAPNSDNNTDATA